ncbi:MAG: phenylacetate--CoA ligase family protein [Nitrospinota bacterium]
MEKAAYWNPEVETAPRQAVRRLQWEKLRPQLAYVFERSGFYRQKYDRAGVSLADIKSLDDLSRLPLTTKKEWEEEQAAHPPFGRNHTEPLEDYIRLFQTSGTTGRNLRVMETRKSWDWRVETAAYLYRSAGVSSRDRVFFAFQFGPFAAFWTMFGGAERLGATVIPSGGFSSEERLRLILDLEATVIVCTPSYAMRLVEVARREGLDIAGSAVRRTIHAGEPGVSIPPTRRAIERAWGGKSFEFAGMAEVGLFGYSCVEQTGVHALEAEHVIEVLNPATGEPVGEGSEGELVVTNLGRHGFPAVRYRTGDLVRPAGRDCPCGRKFLLLEGGVIGRVDNMLLVRGVNVFPSAVERVLRECVPVDEWQLVLENRASGGDEITLRFEPQEREVQGGGLSGEVGRALSRSHGGLRFKVEIAEPGSLPRHEFKARRIVDRRPS